MKKKIKILTLMLLLVLLITACSSSKVYNLDKLINVEEANILVVYNLKDTFYTADINIIKDIYDQLNDVEANKLSDKERDEAIKGRYIDNSVVFTTFMNNDEIIGGVHIYSDEEIIIFDDTMGSDNYNAYRITNPKVAADFIAKVRSFIEY